MTTTDLLSNLSSLIEQFEGESRVERAATKAEITKICARLENTQGVADRPRWKELVERVRGYAKGQRDYISARNAVLLLEEMNALRES